MLKIAWKENYCHPLPEGHRFPMIKYDLLPEQLIYEGTINESSLFEPGILEDKDILRVHTDSYLTKLRQAQLTRAEERKTGFPFSDALLERELTINQGTIDCVHYALKYGVAFNIAGGTHHAFSDRGEGFCLLNDQAIAAAYLLEHKLATQILIIDLDVHQGNGTAEIFRDNPSVFTFSMHGAKNYPLHKEQSDLDIALEDGTLDKIYLSKLYESLSKLMDDVQPDFLFFQSGVDVLKEDKLGRLALSLEGCKERDKIVLEIAHRNRIPLVACMGGGYSENIRTIIEAHANTYRVASELYF